MAALIGRIPPPIHLTLLWQGGSYWHINGSVPRELDHNGSSFVSRPTNEAPAAAAMSKQMPKIERFSRI
jgi:hypothetical protein